MYTIQNIRNGYFVYGTDYRYSPPQQKTSKNQMLTYEDLKYAKIDFNVRHCTKYYRIVELKPAEVSREIPLDNKEGYEI